MYQNVRSRVKHNNNLSDSFECYIGVRQGECLSPFLFSMFVNDLEECFINNGAKGIDIDMLKMFLILYADDIVIFAKNASDLQHNLNIYTIIALNVNISKTKVMVFRKAGRLPNDICFIYDGKQIDIINKFIYLGILFTTGGSFSEAQNTLAGQSLRLFTF